MKKYLTLVLKILVSLSLIAYLLYSQDINLIKKTISIFNLFWLFVSLVLLLLGTFFSCLRWQTILQSSGKNVELSYLYKLYIEGYFYNNFLPTQLGGDFYKSLALGKKIDDKTLAFFSVFLERFGGLVMLFVLATFGIGSFYGLKGTLISVALLIFGLVMYFPVLNFANKLLGKKIKVISKFKEASDLFIKNRQAGLLVLGYSFLVQIASMAGTWSLFYGFGVNLPVLSLVAFVPLAGLALLIPSFNGFGTQETVYAILFANVGVTNAVSISASIMNHIVRLILSLVGGVLVLFFSIKHHKVSNT